MRRFQVGRLPTASLWTRVSPVTSLLPPVGSLAVLAAVGCAIVAALACGGAAFSVVDGGPDATTSDAPVADVLEEPPVTCEGDFVCVPAIPAGWTGPLEVYSGTVTAPPCSA